MVILCFREGGKDFVHIGKNQWQIEDFSDRGDEGVLQPIILAILS